MAHAFRARAIYGLQVPPGVFFVPAHKYAAAIKITMAAIDPNEEVEEADDKSPTPRIPRSTLKLVRLPSNMIEGDSDSDDEDFDPEEFAKLIGDDSEDSDEEESSAGPSDPKKAKKAKQDAQLKALTQALENNDDDDSDDDMDDVEEDAIPNGKTKGKAKASESDEEDSEDDEDDISLDEEETVGMFNVCTLDTERNYQQPIDIFIEAGEPVGFRVEGTHTIHLTGNIISYYDDEESDSEDDDEDGLYDLEPDMDELLEDVSDEEDALDGVRVTEVDTDDEEAPKLVEAPQKGKKRPAEEEAESLDDLLKKETEQKLSKKQLKKMKNNKGEAVSTKEEVKVETKKETKKDPKTDKKVQFAKNLEQGPTGSEAKKTEKAALGVKVVKGVTVDDRKIGNGRAVKNGDKVGVRYIGKLENGKVFDSNKKGKPFSFRVGKGEVIKGWEIGLVGMSIGGERRLTIPANLAYGSKGVPGIPPNSTLIFDIKLLEIN